MSTVAFFNNKGGVGTTSLVYHLAYMFADQGVRCLAVDLDPQANLSAMFLEEERLAELWRDDHTVAGCVQPLVKGTGDLAPAHTERIARNVQLVVGDLRLSRFEDHLAESWGRCLGGDERAFRILSSFYRLIEQSKKQSCAELVLMDLGPNLGALNRAALLAADHIVMPLAPDLFSLRGIENLGPTLKDWREGWKRRIEEAEMLELDVELPVRTLQPAGYVLMSFGVRDRRPVKAYATWLRKIPTVYRTKVLSKKIAAHRRAVEVDQDPNCLATLKHYRSLMPMAIGSYRQMLWIASAG